MSSWLNNNKKPLKKFNIHTISNLPINTSFVPTFHILIATAGRPSLKNILDSLKNELFEKDAITIVFDGEGSINNSNFEHNWIAEHNCKINIIEQIPNLGFWGHAIRNKYQGILEPNTTFIMNADDDDIYIAGTFNKLRTLCSDSNTLYIAKFLVKSKNILVPSQNYQILQDDIGTPCGIIPFNIANKSIWELKYGGDFDYYNHIKKFVKQVKFLNLVIYQVL